MFILWIFDDIMLFDSFHLDISQVERAVYDGYKNWVFFNILTNLDSAGFYLVYQLNLYNI